MKPHEMPWDREKRTPEDLRRVLGRIYPEEIVDQLMVQLGFDEDKQYSGLIEEE